MGVPTKNHNYNIIQMRRIRKPLKNASITSPSITNSIILARQEQYKRGRNMMLMICCIMLTFPITIDSFTNHLSPYTHSIPNLQTHHVSLKSCRLGQANPTTGSPKLWIQPNQRSIRFLPNNQNSLRLPRVTTTAAATLTTTTSLQISTNGNNQNIQNPKHNPISQQPQQKSIDEFHIPITEVDMRYNLRTPLTYNPTKQLYTHTPIIPSSSKASTKQLLSNLSLTSYLSHFFLPSSVTPSYYTYIRWRILQRYINAIVHVLGTQSLLMGLGFKSNKVGFASASLTWVCKDALGKLARMIWASKMGQKFDSDAKRWRFRSSLVFALGNFLEICALAFPKWFLVWATFSNAMKQMSMLTSSATRNALYNSFSLGGTGTSEDHHHHHHHHRGVVVEDSNHNNRNNNNNTSTSSATSSSSSKNRGGVDVREGGGGNIGDITAKGEAQIAVVDLLGIASGIALSKIIGVRVRNVVLTWLFLQVCEIACMYQEIRSVVFRVLNFERLWSIVEKFVDMNLDEEEDFVELSHSKFTSNYNSTTSMTKTSSSSSSSSSTEPAVHSTTNNHNAKGDSTLNLPPSQRSKQKQKKRKVISFYSHEEKYKREFIPTPMQMAQKEKIFLPPEILARRSNCFGSFSRTNLNPRELYEIMDIFKGEKFVLIVGENKKKKHRSSSSSSSSSGGSSGSSSSNSQRSDGLDPREHCHIVLHKDATNMDIVKSSLALGILRLCLLKRQQQEQHTSSTSSSFSQTNKLRTQECLPMLQLAKDISDEWFPRFLKTLQSRGWATPARYMFGKVTMRADWPIVSTNRYATTTKTDMNDGNDVNGSNGNNNGAEQVKGKEEGVVAQLQ